MANKVTIGIDPKRKQPDQISVVLREDYREDYANSVQVNASVWDFLLRFGRLNVKSPEKLTFSSFAGIYMSPQQAKALHLVLAQNIAQYEATFGEIRIEQPQADLGGQPTFVQ